MRFQLGELKEEWGSNLKLFSFRKECLADKEEMRKQLELLSQQHSLLKHQLSEANKVITAHTKQIAGKVDGVELDDMTDLIHTLPTRAQTEQMQKHLHRTLAEYRIDNERMLTGFEHQNTCLRTFDEVLSQKCNKHTLSDRLNEFAKEQEKKFGNESARRGTLVKEMAELRE